MQIVFSTVFTSTIMFFLCRFLLDLCLKKHIKEINKKISLILSTEPKQLVCS